MAEELRRLPLDLEELILAMEDSSREVNEHYLNTETGEVVLLPTELTRAVEEDDWEEQKQDLPPWQQELVTVVEDVFWDETTRWVPIPAISSREAYEHMQRFADTVSDARLHELMDVALDGQGAFRRFRDVLAGFPEERERWFAFKGALVREWALEWLDSIGVEPAPSAKADGDTPTEQGDTI